MESQSAGLLVLLFVAHFLGDFTPLVTQAMLKAKAAGAPLGPFVRHAAIHGCLVALAVSAVARPDLGLLALAAGLEFGGHLSIDWIRAQAGQKWPAQANPSTQTYWTALGLDQLAHALVLIAIAALVS